MFQDIAEPSVRVRSRTSYVVPVSIVAHLAVVALAFLVPLIAPGVLPNPAVTLLAFVSRDIPLPAEPRPAPRPSAPGVHSDKAAKPWLAPLEAPDTIAPELPVEIPMAPPGTITGIGDLTAVIEAAAPPPPPPAPAAAPEAALRIGGDIRPPTKIKDVRPGYPAIAQTARIEGLVIIETTIGPTGHVIDARVLRSVPLLDDAALDAVRQWEFTPTLLNGTPVSVLMTVTVNFSLR